MHIINEATPPFLVPAGGVAWPLLAMHLDDEKVTLSPFTANIWKVPVTKFLNVAISCLIHDRRCRGWGIGARMYAMPHAMPPTNRACFCKH
jgi:hypothetical protein